MRKRKDVDSADQDSSDGATVKKARVVWSVDLHQKFVNAVNQIGFDSESSKKS
jgi:two-component response regulator (ARR-B family)